jgi:hypothetical protein
MCNDSGSVFFFTSSKKLLSHVNTCEVVSLQFLKGTIRRYQKWARWCVMFLNCNRKRRSKVGWQISIFPI